MKGFSDNVLSVTRARQGNLTAIIADAVDNSAVHHDTGRSRAVTVELTELYSSLSTDA